MGHHHKKHRRQESTQLVQSQQNTPNLDLGSMLQNLNLGDIDMSKVDMNKVQSIIENMKSNGTPLQNPISQFNNADAGSPNQNLNMLDALKELAPKKKAKKIDRLMKLLQLTNTMNSGIMPPGGYQRQSQSGKKHKR